jgi:hypothetical protein
LDWVYLGGGDLYYQDDTNDGVHQSGYKYTNSSSNGKSYSSTSVTSMTSSVYGTDRKGNSQIAYTVTDKFTVKSRINNDGSTKTSISNRMTLNIENNYAGDTFAHHLSTGDTACRMILDIAIGATITFGAPVVGISATTSVVIGFGYSGGEIISTFINGGFSSFEAGGTITDTMTQIISGQNGLYTSSTLGCYSVTDHLNEYTVKPYSYYSDYGICGTSPYPQ